MSGISNDWAEALKPEFAKPYYRELYEKVKYGLTDTLVNANLKTERSNWEVLERC